MAHGGALRLLSFGRLLPYKGLDLLAAAMSQLGPRVGPGAIELRVVGSGPQSPELDTLRRLPGVTVENRGCRRARWAGCWPGRMRWCYRIARQAKAVSPPRLLRPDGGVVATRVGGLAEQLAGAPGRARV